MTEAAARTGRTWADSWFAPVFLAALTAAAFLPALAGEFLYDDLRFIVRNPNVQRPDSWLALFTDAGTADPSSPWGLVRPLRTFEFALDRAVFGAGPLAFHVHSLLWHLAATVLLFLVLRRLLEDARAALLAALVWGVYPAHVESVAWITSRGDVAMGACAFAAVLFALRSKGYDRDLVLSLVAALLAVLYKEPAIVVCVAVAALRWTKLSRAPLWPYFALSAAYFGYHQLVEVGETGLHVQFVLGGSRVGTFATMARGFGFYLAEAFLPAFAQDWYLTPSTSFADGAALAWLAVHAALVASAFLARRAEPRWTLAVALFYVFFGPVSNLVLSVSIPTAERFMYVPLAGVALAVGLALVRTKMRAWPAALVAAAAFGATTTHRCGFWHDEPRLWAEVIADHESPRGRETKAEDEETEAIKLRDAAAAMPPGPERDRTQARVHELFEASLADAHQSIEDTYAFELVRRSTGVPAMRAEYNASNICYQLGRYDEALYHAEEAIAMYADVDPAPHYDRAWPLWALGFPAQAIDSMRRARELGPKKPDAEMADFFLRAASDCQKIGLFMAARAGFQLAADVAPPGPILEQAKRFLAAALARPRSAADAAAETRKTAELDAALAARPRSCPVRRDHAIRN